MGGGRSINKGKKSAALVKKRHCCCQPARQSSIAFKMAALSIFLPINTILLIRSPYSSSHAAAISGFICRICRLSRSGKQAIHLPSSVAVFCLPLCSKIYAVSG